MYSLTSFLPDYLIRQTEEMEEPIKVEAPGLLIPPPHYQYTSTEILNHVRFMRSLILNRYVLGCSQIPLEHGTKASTGMVTISI